MNADRIKPDTQTPQTEKVHGSRPKSIAPASKHRHAASATVSVNASSQTGPIRQAAEGSLSLRVITSAMAIVGILAACQMAESPVQLSLFGIFGTAIGSYISYRRRQANNFWIKWALAAGILVVLGFFVEEILYRVQATIADARAPLSNMLVSLQALHSFDLPRRRDLNVSALVGLILMASAATLSKDLIYGVYLLTFICFGAYMLYLDCASRTADGAILTHSPAASAQGIYPRTAAKTRLCVALLVILLPLFSLIVFLAIPRLDIKLLGNVRVSLKLNIPFLNSNKIDNPMLHSAKRGDGSLVVNPQAYHGFCEELDLNYRGKLSDDMVLKVAAPKGEFWRAMAFDTYDGHQWTMSKPRKTYDRLTVYGSAIQLAPIPSLETPARVPLEELAQVFYLEQDQPNLIPAAAVPLLIYFPTNKVQVDSYGSLRSPVFMEKDMVYTVFSSVPRYNLEQLRHQAPLTEEVQENTRLRLSPYLQLPESLPAQVRQFADAISGDSENWYNKAEQINLYLQRQYKYNLDVPPTAPDQDCVADFLFRRKSGYCEHFSTSFVVLCRCEGIPARLVTGFRPGEYNPFTGLWDVRMRDAHAWAEIFLPRWGWVTFDPTPDGVMPGSSGAEQHNQFEFVIKQIADTIDEFARQPWVKSSGKWIWGILSQCAHTVSSWLLLLDAFWQPAVMAMALVGAAALTVRLARFRPTDVDPGILSPIPDNGRGEATRQYLQLCHELSRLSITRKASESAESFSRRVKDQLGDNNAQLCDQLESFFEAYSAVRFGTSGNQDQLNELAASIRQRLHLIETQSSSRQTAA